MLSGGAAEHAILLPRSKIALRIVYASVKRRSSKIRCFLDFHKFQQIQGNIVEKDTPEGGRLTWRRVDLRNACMEDKVGDGEIREIEVKSQTLAAKGHIRKTERASSGREQQAYFPVEGTPLQRRGTLIASFKFIYHGYVLVDVFVWILFYHDNVSIETCHLYNFVHTNISIIKTKGG